MDVMLGTTTNPAVSGGIQKNWSSFFLSCLLSHSPLQTDSASELQHCSISWLQLSTMPSSWALSQETPRNRANCSTNVPRSWRGGRREKGKCWLFCEKGDVKPAHKCWEHCPSGILRKKMLLPQTAATHSQKEHTVLCAYTRCHFGSVKHQCTHIHTHYM